MGFYAREHGPGFEQAFAGRRIAALVRALPQMACEV